MSSYVSQPPIDDHAAAYALSCQLARSGQEADLAALRRRLADPGFLDRLDSPRDYDGMPVRLRVAGVLQVLAQNRAPGAADVLLSLTKSPAFVAHPSRIELLIQALSGIRPAPPGAVAFWDKYCLPNDGFSSVTVWALLDNGTPPAVALFENKLLDARFSDNDRRAWLTGAVLRHRNGLSLLQACQRLLAGTLEQPYRLLLVDVLFDYRPEQWYGAGDWLKPPPRSEASPEALRQLRQIGLQTLESQPLADRQRARIKAVIKEADALLQGPAR